jgi:MFS family permease
MNIKLRLGKPHALPWIIWTITVIFVLFQFMLQISPSVMVSNLEHAFNIGTVGIGVLSGCIYYTYLPLQIPAGILVDKIGARKVLLISALGTIITCVGFAIAHSFWLAFTSRLLMGVFIAPVLVSSMIVASQWFSAARFALLAGIIEGIGLLGAAFGENIFAWGVKNIGWRNAMLLCAVIASIIIILIWLIVRDKGRVKEQINEIKFAEHPEQQVNAFKMPQVWLSGFFAGFLFAPLITFASLWCIPYMIRLCCTNLKVAAGLCSLIFIGAAIGNPIVGWFSSFINRRKLTMQIGTVMALIFMIAITFINPKPVIVIAIVLFCLGFFTGVYVLPFAVMRDILPDKSRGMALGFVNMMCILLGGPLLQPFIGWILDAPATNIGHTVISLAVYRYGLDVISICLLLGLIVSIFIKESLH